MNDKPRTLLIACGALAREIVALKNANGWEHLDVQCLPAELHNRPARIPGAVRAQIEAHRADYQHMFVAYADCGTGGLLDRVLEEAGVQRIAGAHCYEFFAGSAAFEQLHDDDPGTFYLTDFLLRHFDRLVIKALGLDRHPHLRDEYFGHYRRLVFLAQLPPSPATLGQAQTAAQRLGLAFELRHTGYGELACAMARAHDTQVIQWHH